jgi:tetratricopeptide (TPR) repeat protein
VTSTFFKRDGRFFVRTDGPDGELHDYAVSYAFGVTPLQQYLIEFPGGRYQTLSICWDTRPREEGGQRWFHLYPDEKIAHDDILHWTGPNQNWNYTCAECHSTDLKKNYDLDEDRYDTTWWEINVSCEACHGPASGHMEWARAVSDVEPVSPDSTLGLAIRLADTDGGAWVYDMEMGTAQRTVPRQSHLQVEICARCHARRTQMYEDYVHGRPLLDTHGLSLLDEVLYHADGQILEEVYVYGSFIQSKMFRQGVTCSDCHDSHSLDVRAPGNRLCMKCHLPTRFDTPAHHFHERGGPGASCVECHMPARDYMVVDPRRDHSLRIPRPDLSVKLGTPNACNGCHAEESPQWAAEAVATWYGPDRRAEPHFGEALHAGRAGDPGAHAALIRLAGDGAEPGIARASALSLLSRSPGPAALPVIERALDDDDPLVRRSALSALEVAGPADQLRLASPLLDDPVRLVRTEAARLLAPVPPGLMTAPQRQSMEQATAEFIESELTNAERPESHTNLGSFHADRGRPEEAEAEYRVALRLDPAYVPAWVNLVDLYRLLGRDDEGERVIREALEIVPEVAALHHTHGLLLVRLGRTPEALAALKWAARLEPENARYRYVYAVALNSTGDIVGALRELEDAHNHHPNDRYILLALVTFHRDAGEVEQAIPYAERLVRLDPAYRPLLEQLEAAR